MVSFRRDTFCLLGMQELRPSSEISSGVRLTNTYFTTSSQLILRAVTSDFSTNHFMAFIATGTEIEG